MKNYKVVFLTRRYLPHLGGVELHIQGISSTLVKKNFSVTVITERDDQREDLYENDDILQILRIPITSVTTIKFDIWGWLFKHISLLVNADIIHIHDVFFWIIPFIPLLKLCKKKIFITFHGHEGNTNPTKIQIMWHRLASLTCDGNICIGGFHKKWYKVTPKITSFGATKTYNGRFNKRGDIKKIIYLGRLSEDNGIMSYLHAIKKISQSSEILLDVYGEGSQSKEARTYCAKNHLPVTFYGFINKDSIDWQSYDVAFVSRYLAILECFSAGIPIISHYDIEIKRDYILLTPFRRWLTVAKNKDEIADAFYAITSNPNVKNIKLARDRANKQTWERLAQNYMTLWNLTK